MLIAHFVKDYIDPQTFDIIAVIVFDTDTHNYSVAMSNFSESTIQREVLLRQALIKFKNQQYGLPQFHSIELGIYSPFIIVDINYKLSYYNFGIYMFPNTSELTPIKTVLHYIISSMITKGINYTN